MRGWGVEVCTVVGPGSKLVENSRAVNKYTGMKRKRSPIQIRHLKMDTSGPGVKMIEDAKS